MHPGDDVAQVIREAGTSIYDDLTDVPGAYYDIDTLEARLNTCLIGRRWDYPIRTRSKVAKEAVAEALGYPIPRSFARTQPRFPGQNLDVAVQMSDNLQIWNQEVDPLRRYALIRVEPGGLVTGVRVVTGEVIGLWDRTGTLTSKYQAKRLAGRTGSTLVSTVDTPSFITSLHPVNELPAVDLESQSPTERPAPEAVLTISGLYRRLLQLEGTVLSDPGVTQDRSRGVVFQQLVCHRIGLGPYGDAGQFPDVLCQALEVKLQLSPTVDLGLVLPSSTAQAQELGFGLRHADARYAVAYATRVAVDAVRIDALVVTTGQAFFSEFQRFEGKVQNKKLQIPLPGGLFEAK